MFLRVDCLVPLLVLAPAQLVPEVFDSLGKALVERYGRLPAQHGFSSRYVFKQEYI